MLSFTKDLMRDMHTLEGCLELGFTLQRIPLRVTNMYMELVEAQAAPHIKTGPVISATGGFLVSCITSWGGYNLV